MARVDYLLKKKIHDLGDTLRCIVCGGIIMECDYCHKEKTNAKYVKVIRSQRGHRAHVCKECVMNNRKNFIVEEKLMLKWDSLNRNWDPIQTICFNCYVPLVLTWDDFTQYYCPKCKTGFG